MAEKTLKIKFKKANKVENTHVGITLRYLLFGVVFSEVLFLTYAILIYLEKYVAVHMVEAVLISGLYIITIPLYLYFRDFYSISQRVLKSRRLDLWLPIASGFSLNIVWGGIGTNTYSNILSAVSIAQLLSLLMLPWGIAFILMYRIWFFSNKSKKKERPPFFISDKEILGKEEDLLNLTPLAEKFAKRVLNNGSNESLVFGVDGPWGVGKSSFVNFCKEYWEKNHRNEVIVYVFNPLRYENRENLFEKFIDGLSSSILEQIFVPELKPVLLKYGNIIKKISGKLFGFIDIEVLNKNHSYDEVFSELETILKGLDKRIIIILDDLDRLPLTTVKDLLFTVKKSFMLPNVSYVFCYDVININSLKHNKIDTEKVTEFLEKFINVKVGIYLDSNKLLNYATTNLEEVLRENSQTDGSVVSAAIGGLHEILKSPEFDSYFPFIGDLRKLKRLINTILLLDIDKTDFELTDLNSYDLIHLLLIYMNYPHIFRKIYNNETCGKKGFFSVVTEYEDGYPKIDTKDVSYSDTAYKNSTHYTDFIKSESISTTQKFLLNKIFNVARIVDKGRIGSVTEEIRASYACFNGEMLSTEKRALENYLNLIVSAKKPQTIKQHRFFMNKVNKIREGILITDIFDTPEFSFSSGEQTHRSLWKLIINNARSFKKSIGENLILHLINTLEDYSHFEYKEAELGLRSSLIANLVKLLDQAGWGESNEVKGINSEGNIAEIAEWVFGKKRHKGQGILQTLSHKNRGILGFYDTLLFRLFCSTDRGGDTYNLTNALAKYDNPKAPTAGNTRIIAEDEMRLISQAVYKTFKKQYIDTGTNMFDLIDDLSLDNLCGKFLPSLSSLLENENKMTTIEASIQTTKSRLKTFIVYQLGYHRQDFGTPCGFYDPTGSKDENKIRDAINDYLFNICFNPEINNTVNYEHFLIYLLMNFVSRRDPLSGNSYVANVNEFTKILIKEKLQNYWRKNKEKIQKLEFVKKEKTILTPNYSATYKEDLPEVYKILDKLIETNK